MFNDVSRLRGQNAPVHRMLPMPKVARSQVNARKYSQYPGTITERFGKRLRHLRQEGNFTQVDLAKLLGIDRSFLSDVERGKKAMSLSYLETVAQGFGLSLAELLADL